MSEANPSESKIKSFQHKIFQFYKQNKRDLPWRNTTDPYKILVSEFMLQQTQVNRVITYYKKWMKQWPTVYKLADEEYKNVLQAWMGLGYNRRAMYLHQSAKVIAHEFKGDVLQAVHHFDKLPGIGLYTCKAIQIFAANENIATVDTNIRRILINEFNLKKLIPDKDLFQLAERCLPKKRSRDWHNALMDYGAIYLTSKKTGIKPKTIQSKFDGSDRQIRGKILRMLLNDQQSEYQLEQKLQIDSKRLSKILVKMKKEGTVSKTDSFYHVPER